MAYAGRLGGQHRARKARKPGAIRRGLSHSPAAKWACWYCQPTTTFKDVEVRDLEAGLPFAGIKRQPTESEPEPGMAEDTNLVLDKSVVAAIDFRLTKIYLTDATPDRRPEHIVARDPRGYFHEVHHRAGNPDGTYEADDPEYWREVTEALAPAGAILVLGHGQGKANASHHWVAYVEKHRKDVAAKIIADLPRRHRPPR